MKDSHENSDGDTDATNSDSTESPTVAPGHSVSDDAEWTQVVQKSVDESPTNSLTVTIITAIADAEGVQPMEIKSPPLYHVFDTAALEAAFFTSKDPVHLQEAETSTEFMYQGYRIVVQSDGWVRVYKRSED